MLVNTIQPGKKKSRSRKCPLTHPPRPTSSQIPCGLQDLCSDLNKPFSAPISHYTSPATLAKGLAVGTDEAGTALSPVLGVPHLVSPAPASLFEAPFPQPCQPPTAKPIDTGSLFHPACLGCRRVTAVLCLITDGLRRCQPMNKITVFLQCKCRSSLVEGL